MKQWLGHVALIVDDYDTALAYYTEVMGFDIAADIATAEGKRWVLVSPKGSDCTILLVKAQTPDQENHIGNQTGGKVFLFLYTDNFDKAYGNFKNNGIRFLEEPRTESYGKVVLFEDLYGNRWDLIESVTEN